jgi:hypothetical protein
MKDKENLDFENYEKLKKVIRSMSTEPKNQPSRTHSSSLPTILIKNLIIENYNQANNTVQNSSDLPRPSILEIKEKILEEENARPKSQNSNKEN